MYKRTAEIIMVLKGNHNLGEFHSYKEMLAAYMSDKYDRPAEEYTDAILLGIIKEVVQDYISSCTSIGQVSDFMRHYFYSNKWHHDSETSRWLSALACVQVKVKDERGNYQYANGFTEENATFVCKRGKERFMVVETSDDIPNSRGPFVIRDNKTDKYYTDDDGNVLTFSTKGWAMSELQKIITKETQKLMKNQCKRCECGAYCGHQNGVLYCEDYERVPKRRM